MSYRPVEELMEERGVAIDHATIQRWVVQDSPLLEAAFHRRKRPVWTSWSCVARFPAILMDYELGEITPLLEEQNMQSEDSTHSGSAEVQVIAASLPQQADAHPLAQTSPSGSGRRLTTRELARRRRQRLLELLQQAAKPPASH